MEVGRRRRGSRSGSQGSLEGDSPLAPAVSRCTSSRNTLWSGQALDARTVTVRVLRVTSALMRSSRRRRLWHWDRPLPRRCCPRAARRRRAAATLQARVSVRGAPAAIPTPERGDFNDDLAALGPRALAERLAPLLGPGPWTAPATPHARNGAQRVP